MPDFGELDARLSWVTRWTVVNTLKKQSVAEHCFNVERIALMVAVEWLKWKDSNLLFEVSQIALHHDDDEAVTGDLPSPAKWALGEKWIDAHRDLWYNRPGQAHDIVKLADKMEAFWFLTMERKLGNTYIAAYLKELHTKVLESAASLGVSSQAIAWIKQTANIEGTTRGSAA